MIKTSIFLYCSVGFGVLTGSTCKSALDHTSPIETGFRHPLNPFNPNEPTRTLTDCPVRTDSTGYHNFVQP